jgi:hypothetical protein
VNHKAIIGFPPFCEQRYTICSINRTVDPLLDQLIAIQGEMNMLPTTVERVPAHTTASDNESIRQRTEANIARYKNAGRAAIDERLRELDAEWDIERTLEANASTAILVGLALGATVDRRWFAFPAVVAGFLFQHAVQGWCPPLPVFRHFGVRTSYEIDYERYALKALRGDFRHTGQNPNQANPKAVLQSMQK